MLPLAHIYVSTEVAGRKSPLLVFGSVLPDVSWTSKSEIGRDETHYAPRELYEYIITNCPEFTDLALGVRLHSNVGKGADYYSDGEGSSGFAYIEGKNIEANVADLLGEEKNRNTATLSHSFIEAATDALLNEDKPEILDLYDNAIKDINLVDISECLSEYLKLDSAIVLSEIKNFLNFVGPEAYSSKDKMIDGLLLLIKQGRGKAVDRNESANTLSTAIDLMRGKYQSYLNNAIINMRRDFGDLVASPSASR